jgi:uncharacterized protein (DUF488 family)
MPNPFFTVGHSTRDLEEFAHLLGFAQVQCVVDVRAVPRSRTNPQYNSDTLPRELAARGIGYVHRAALGGLRGRRKGEPSPNTFWENESFRNYADYAQSETFRAALADLRVLGHKQRCALMCAEAVWWRCHRRIIADYLMAAGESVFHILGPPPRLDEASLTPAARPAGNGILVYPGQA